MVVAYHTAYHTPDHIAHHTAYHTAYPVPTTLPTTLPTTVPTTLCSARLGSARLGCLAVAVAVAAVAVVVVAAAVVVVEVAVVVVVVMVVVVVVVAAQTRPVVPECWRRPSDGEPEAELVASLPAQRRITHSCASTARAPPSAGECCKQHQHATNTCQVLAMRRRRARCDHVARRQESDVTPAWSRPHSLGQLRVLRHDTVPRTSRYC